jgi:WD40 repeat protein
VRPPPPCGATSVVTGSGDRTIKVFDAGAGRLLRTLRGHSANMGVAALANLRSADGQPRLLSAAADGVKVRDWNE